MPGPVIDAEALFARLALIEERQGKLEAKVISNHEAGNKRVDDLGRQVDHQAPVLDVIEGAVETFGKHINRTLNDLADRYVAADYEEEEPDGA